MIVIKNNKSIGKQINSFLTSSQSINQGDKISSSKSKEKQLNQCINRSQSKPGSNDMIQKKASHKVLQSNTNNTLLNFDFTKIDQRFFHQIINRHFKHLKRVIPITSYNEIKEYFLNIINSIVPTTFSGKLSTNDTMTVNNTNLSSNIINESQSSIFAYFDNSTNNPTPINNTQPKEKDTKEPLKLSMDFQKTNNPSESTKVINEKLIISHIPSIATATANHHHNNTNNIGNNSHANVNINVVSSKRNNQVKHSLYNLIKGRSHVTPSNSKSKSASRECSGNTRKPLSNPKHKEVININLTKKTSKPALSSIHNKHNKSTSNQPILNGKLFTKIASADKKIGKEGSLEKSNKKLGIVNFTIESVKSDKPLTKKISMNPNKSKALVKYDKNQKITNEIAAKLKEMKPQMIYLKMNSSNPPPLDDCSNSKSNSKGNNIKIQPLNLKGDVMKEIEQTLDDNYKGMFNFSYENFLSKESESMSKQSQDDNNNNNDYDDNNNDNHNHSQSI